MSVCLSDSALHLVTEPAHLVPASLGLVGRTSPCAVSSVGAVGTWALSSGTAALPRPGCVCGTPLSHQLKQITRIAAVVAPTGDLALSAGNSADHELQRGLSMKAGQGPRGCSCAVGFYLWDFALTC